MTSDTPYQDQPPIDPYAATPSPQIRPVQGFYPPPQGSYPPPQYQPQFQPAGYFNSSPIGSTGSNGFGVTALVTGIVGLVLFWVPGLGVLLGILATVFGGVGVNAANKGKANNKGMSIAGLVMGILIVAGAVITLIVVLSAAGSTSAVSQY